MIIDCRMEAECKSRKLCPDGLPSLAELRVNSSLFITNRSDPVTYSRIACENTYKTYLVCQLAIQTFKATNMCYTVSVVFQITSLIFQFVYHRHMTVIILESLVLKKSDIKKYIKAKVMIQ